ncbi:MAG: four helix bundle protein [Firmicutes bacterium HGW-Firmicutes-1]|jgi:four helix bundle protein|nr:MAG: four helix bundle protein [Firmicutes bacterium HGW-Firmicutes-1]
MNELLAKAFDFGIRIVELSNYLDEEKKQFPLIERLLECGTSIGVHLRISKEYAKNQTGSYVTAYELSLETEYLLELLVKTGFLHENQSIPILNDCKLIKDETAKLLTKNQIRSE